MVVGRGCTAAVLPCTNTPRVKRVRLLIAFHRFDPQALIMISGSHGLASTYTFFTVTTVVRDQDADSSSSLTTHPGAACIAGGHGDHGRLKLPPTEPTYEAATVRCSKSFR